MKVSVVIPTINEENYIRRTLESFKLQTVQPGEIIISDGGSTDKTVDIAKEYGAMVTVHTGSTVTQARQYGVDCATGDIIVGADADCVYPPHYIETLIHDFEINPSIVGVGGPAEFEPHPRWIHIGWKLVYRHIGFWFRITHSIIYIPAFNFAFRKTPFLAIGGYRMYLDYAGDEIDILGRLKSIGKFYFDPRLTVQASSRRAKAGAFALIIKHTLIDYYLGYLLALLFQKPVIRGEAVR